MPEIPIPERWKTPYAHYKRLWDRKSDRVLAWPESFVEIIEQLGLAEQKLAASEALLKECADAAKVIAADHDEILRESICDGEDLRHWVHKQHQKWSDLKEVLARYRAHINPTQAAESGEGSTR